MDIFPHLHRGNNEDSHIEASCHAFQADISSHRKRHCFINDAVVNYTI